MTSCHSQLLKKKQPRLQKAVFMDSHLSRMSNVHNPYDIPLYWLLNRDPYFMTYEIIPLYLGRFSSQKKQQIAGVNWSLLIWSLFHLGDSWMYPYQRTPMGNPYISPINTMGTLLGVHPIVPWSIPKKKDPRNPGLMPYDACVTLRLSDSWFLVREKNCWEFWTYESDDITGSKPLKLLG